MAVILDIADAVVAAINGGTFSQPVAAERHYQPKFELSEMTDLKVSVVPRGLVSKTLDRGRDSFDYQIDVAVQQKTDMTPAALDALMGLVEEMADHFRRQSLAGYPQARCVEVKNEPVYSLEHLDELRQFTSVLTMTFRAWRPA
jgi:hypothetical protein